MTVYYGDPQVESATGFSDECLLPSSDKTAAATEQEAVA